MAQLDLGISAVGMATALGLDADATSAAVRARISGVILQRHLSLSGPDPEWDPREALRAGRVPSLDPRLVGAARLRELATTALGDTARRGGLSRADLASTAILFSLPEDDAATSAWGLEVLPHAILERAALTGARHVEVLREGHTGGLTALGRAGELVAARAVARALIVAADTLVSADRVAVLDASGRLRSKRTRDGFVPGEGSVALLVAPLDDASMARVGALGRGHEPDGLHSDRAPTGQGLEAALRGTVANGRPIEWLLSDMNGESHRGMELAAARARLADVLAADVIVDHPAELIGDLGAAAGALLLACAAAALADGTAPADVAVVVAGAERGSRVAVSLAAVRGAAA